VNAAGRAILALALALLANAGAAAQEFAPIAPAGPGPTPGGFLENGLAPEASALALEAALTDWYGLPELATGALSAGAGAGPVRAAMGIAQMGDRDLGWQAAAIALGVARFHGGAGLRVAARRDRAVEPDSPAAVRLEERAGLEVGWGGWTRVGRRLVLWASVPQAWCGGTAPPLDRPLETGLRCEVPGGLALWGMRGAASRGGLPDHAAGLSLAVGPLVAWGSARDRPLRGAIGVAATVTRVRVAAVVESHPDLGETLRLGLALGGTTR